MDYCTCGKVCTCDGIGWSIKRGKGKNRLISYTNLITKGGDMLNLYELAAVIGESLEVKIISNEGFNIEFKNCEVKDSKDSSVIGGCWGVGSSIEEAANDYFRKIKGKWLVFDSLTKSRREYSTVIAKKKKITIGYCRICGKDLYPRVGTNNIMDNPAYRTILCEDCRFDRVMLDQGSKFIRFKDIYRRVRYIRRDFIQLVEEVINPEQFTSSDLDHEAFINTNGRTKVKFGDTYTDYIYLRDEVDEVMKLIYKK